MGGKDGGGGGGNSPYYTEKEIPVGLYTGNDFLFKGLVINYGEGGATKWQNRGSETFCAPPSRQGKTFRAPPPF